MESENLDVGCGSIRGHRPTLNGFHVDIQKTEWNKPFLNLVCDAGFLPFRSLAFRSVTASHVLEHTQNPTTVLRELLRVASNLVVVRVPHFLSEVAKQDTKKPFDRHFNVFKRKWFAKELEGYRFLARVNYRSFLMFFNRPYEIEVWVFK